MYRSLLVPLDGAPFAEQALPYALSIARLAGAALQLATVLAPPPGHLHVTPDVTLASPERLRAYLDRVAGRLRAVAPVPVTTTVLHADAVAPALRAHAAGADLVVMTTHGRGLLGSFWLGSVAHELLHDLHVPLFLVRPHGAAADWAEEPPLRSLLLPLDGSARAERILEPAVELAQLMGAAVVLLRVMNILPLGNPEMDPVSMSAPAMEMLAQVQTVQAHVRQEAEAYLEAVAGRLRARGLTVTTRVVIESDAAEGILHEAVPPAVDLVALATHGHRGLTRLVLGSVARKVIHGAAVPILVQMPPTPHAGGG